MTLLLALFLPAYTSVDLQEEAGPLWVVRSLKLSEYSVHTPRGLTFSLTADSLILLEENGNIALVGMNGEPGEVYNLLEVGADPLNAAFDQNSGGLYVFQHGKSQLVRLLPDGQGLPSASRLTRFRADAFGVGNAAGITFDARSGQLLILDAGNSQILTVAPHAMLGFDADEAVRGGRLERIMLQHLEGGPFRGIAVNPGDGHLFIGDPGQRALYELDPQGALISKHDLEALSISQPLAMTFAPSVDRTDDPSIHDLFVLDGGTGEGVTARGQIVELSFRVPAALPPGTTFLPTSVVQIIDTSHVAWSPSSPDPSGIDYWPLTDRLLIVDSEVDEMRQYFQGKNVYQSTTSGTLTDTCSTTAYSSEPTGLAINPDNNHIFVTNDGFQSRVFEIDLGADGIYCTADDTVTTTNVATLYGITDAEDVAYGNNTIFIAGGADAEVYVVPLGADGVLGGDDDGPMTRFDTAALGFSDLEGVDYNEEADTLFIISTKSAERYLGETTISGALLRVYNLAFMGSAGNLRSDVTYAPASRSRAVKSIYIVSRGMDNDSHPDENDGRIWEISITQLDTPEPLPSPTETPLSTLDSHGLPANSICVAPVPAPPLTGYGPAEKHENETEAAIAWDPDRRRIGRVPPTSRSYVDGPLRGIQVKGVIQNRTTSALAGLTVLQHIAHTMGDDSLKRGSDPRIRIRPQVCLTFLAPSKPTPPPTDLVAPP